MPLVQIGAKIPPLSKPETMSHKFQFSSWSYDVKEFNDKHRLLSILFFKLSSHVAYTYQHAILLQWCWFQIRPAYKHSSATYDKMFENIQLRAYQELTHYETLVTAYPEQKSKIRAAPSQQLIKVSIQAHAHLEYLKDQSGFGNRLQKAYDFDEHKDNLLG